MSITVMLIFTNPTDNEYSHSIANIVYISVSSALLASWEKSSTYLREPDNMPSLKLIDMMSGAANRY